MFFSNSLGSRNSNLHLSANQVDEEQPDAQIETRSCSTLFFFAFGIFLHYISLKYIERPMD